MGGKSGSDPQVNSGSLPEWTQTAHKDLLARAKAETTGHYNYLTGKTEGGEYTPYEGDRVGGEHSATREARESIGNLAGGNDTLHAGVDSLRGLSSGTNGRIDNAYDTFAGMTSGTNAIRDTGVSNIRDMTSGTNAVMDEGISAQRGLTTGTNALRDTATDNLRTLQSGTNAEMDGGSAATVGGIGAYAGLDNYDAGEYAQFDNAAANKYMSPYQQAVTNMGKRNAVGDYQRANIRRNSDLVSRGAFGGSRQAIIQSEADKALGTQLSDLQVQGLQDSYSNAQRQFGADRDARFDAFRTNSDVDQARASGYMAGGRQLADIGGAKIANQQRAADSLLTAGQDQYSNQSNNAKALTDAGATQYGNAAKANQELIAAGQDQYANQGKTAGSMAGLGSDQFKNQADVAGDLIAAGEKQHDMDLGIGREQYRMSKDAEAITQAQLDADYGDYLTERDWSKNQMGWYSGMLSGAGNAFTSYTGEDRGGSNNAANLLGLGTAAIGALGESGS